MSKEQDQSGRSVVSSTKFHKTTVSSNSMKTLEEAAKRFLDSGELSSMLAQIRKVWTHSISILSSNQITIRLVSKDQNYLIRKVSKSQIGYIRRVSKEENGKISKLTRDQKVDLRSGSTVSNISKSHNSFLNSNPSKECA